MQEDWTQLCLLADVVIEIEALGTQNTSRPHADCPTNKRLQRAYKNRHLSNTVQTVGYPMYQSARTYGTTRPLLHSQTQPILDISRTMVLEADMAAAHTQTFDETYTRDAAQSAPKAANESVEAVSSTPSSSSTSICDPVFPPLFFRYHGCLDLPSSQRTPFAQYPVSHFPNDDWKKIWRRRPITLDHFAAPTKYIRSDKDLSPKTTYFHVENEFAGYAYRVVIDPTQCLANLTFRRGTTVNICGVNDSKGQYVVEYCQLVRKGIAYLPVHFRQFDGQGFTSPFDPRHMSFILIIPVTFNRSPLLPELNPTVAIHDDHRTLPSTALSSLLPTKVLGITSPYAKYAAEDALKKPWWRCIFC